jgi:2-amino-4-hydroxy-6-hydroxymethyldihydropteridine diphosphokinase
MFPVIDVGPFAIQAGGLILIISFWLGITLTGKYAKSLGTNGDVIENSLIYGLLAGIISARIGFMLQNPDFFIANPLSVFSFTPSMLNQSFGLLVGAVVIFILAQKNHLPIWPTLDTLSPVFLILFIGIHLRNFAVGDAYGLIAEIPWSIFLWGAFRHPVQIYALLLAVPLLIWFLIKSRALQTTGYPRSGSIFLFTLASMGLITSFTHAFVAEKTLIAGIDLIQLLGFGVTAISLFLIYKRRYEPRKHIPVLISMGSNLNPRENLEKALDLITQEFKLRGSSKVYKTKDAKGNADTQDFLNQVIEIETDLPYPVLQERLKSIEAQLGRIKGNKQVVSSDLDILTYGEDVFEYNQKRIPNPDLIKYTYITKPLAEMDPNFRHPGNGQSIQMISQNIKEKSTGRKKKEVDNGVEK